MNLSYNSQHAPAMQQLAQQQQQQFAAAAAQQGVPWGPAPPAPTPLEAQHSACSSMMSTETTQQHHQPVVDSDVNFFNVDRAFAAARPRKMSDKERRQLVKACRATSQSQELMARSRGQQQQGFVAADLQRTAMPAQHQFQAAGHAGRRQQPAARAVLEGQDSADGLDLLIQAAEQADAEQAGEEAPQQQLLHRQQADAPPEQQQHAPASKQDALLAACASAQQAQHSDHVEPVQAPAPASAEHASIDDAAAQDAHMRHAVAAALAAMSSSAAAAAAAGSGSQRSGRQVSAQVPAPSSRPKRAAARDANVLRQVFLQQEAISKRPGRTGGSQHHKAEDRIASLDPAAQLQQEQRHASLPPLPNKKSRSTSHRDSYSRFAAGMQQPAASAAMNAAQPGPVVVAAAEAEAAMRMRGAGSTAGAATDLPAATHPASGTEPAEEVDDVTHELSAAGSASLAWAMTKAAFESAPELQARDVRCRKQSQAAPGAPRSSQLAAPQAAGKAAASSASAAAAKPGSIMTAAIAGDLDPTSQADTPGAAAAEPAATGRPRRRAAAAHASQQLPAGDGDDTAAALGLVSGGIAKGSVSQRSKQNAAKPRVPAATAAFAATIKGRPAQAAQAAAGGPSEAAASEGSSGDDSSSEFEEGSSGSSSSDEDDGDSRAAKRQWRSTSNRRRPGSNTQQRQQQHSGCRAKGSDHFTTTADGVVVVTAASKKPGSKGGRPLGSANRGEMKPRSLNADGQAAYSCRSQCFRGVYMCQHVNVRWRTQFSYARKVGRACSAIWTLATRHQPRRCDRTACVASQRLQPPPQTAEQVPT